MNLKWLKSIAPYGLIRTRQTRLLLSDLGINCKGMGPNSIQQLWQHALNCRYPLWHGFVNELDNNWALVDVGANWGHFTGSAMKFIQPDKIVLIEAQSRCCSALRHIFADYQNMEIVHMAAGNMAGSIEFCNTQSSAACSVLKPLASYAEHYQDGDFSVVGSETVAMRTLDSILGAYDSIGMLKVDVQGFDYEVFQGASETLNKTQLILLEICYQPHYEDEAGFKKANDLLYDSGFELRGVSEPAISKRYGIPLWADAIYQKCSNK